MVAKFSFEELFIISNFSRKLAEVAAKIGRTTCEYAKNELQRQ